MLERDDDNTNVGDDDSLLGMDIVDVVGLASLAKIAWDDVGLTSNNRFFVVQNGMLQHDVYIVGLEVSMVILLPIGQLDLRVPCTIIKSRDLPTKEGVLPEAPTYNEDMHPS